MRLMHRYDRDLRTRRLKSIVLHQSIAIGVRVFVPSEIEKINKVFLEEIETEILRPSWRQSLDQ